jgi:hypothetical protein
MTFQSSFLIRCWLHPTADQRHTRAYQITHVQTGVEFRSADLAAVMQWMTAQNLQYCSTLIENPPADTEAGLEEDPQ